MSFSFRVRADWRGLTAAALIGAGLGLGLVAVVTSAGSGDDATESMQVEAVRAQADASAYKTLADPAFAVPARAAAIQPPRADRRSELDCLTEAVYYEARGESHSGQAAVAQVVLNRTRHSAFPNTVCGVVYQGASRKGCQFSFACNGAMQARRETAAWKRARRVAVQALAGAGVAQIGAATHFHTTGVAPNWGPSLARVGQVGLHVFYSLKPHGPRQAKPLPEEAPQVVFASFTPPAPAHDAPPARELQISVALLETPPEAPVEAVAVVPKPAAAKAVEAKPVEAKVEEASGVHP